MCQQFGYKSFPLMPNIYTHTSCSSLNPVTVVGRAPDYCKISFHLNLYFLGFQYSAPVYEIMQYSKDVGMENKVHTVTCGVKGQSHEVTHVIEDAMASGYWIIVQNAHLGEPWTEELLGILKVREIMI